MKFLSLFFLVLACGQYESNNSAQMGQRVTYNPQELNEDQVSQRTIICEAITAKTTTLSLMQGSPFSFTLSEKNCAGESSEDQTIDVKVEVSDSYIHFVRQNENYFIFKDAETLRSGIFKSYCMSDKAPFTHNGNPVWLDMNQSEFCSKEANTLCVNFKSGLKIPGLENTYKVTNEETFKLNNLPTSQQYGFYTQRVLRSSVSCDSGASLVKAVLN